MRKKLGDGMYNLNDLAYHEKIDINEIISYSKEYLKNTDILKLDSVKAIGQIFKNYEGETEIKLLVDGVMYLTDAITLDTVPYDFQIEIEEILENSLKTLDLIEFLWHYIVLEIPIRYTTSDTKELKSKYESIYEEEEIQGLNNPFKDFFKE